MFHARRLKELESENAKLKRLLADAMLDKAALKDLLAKKLLRPAPWRARADLADAQRGKPGMLVSDNVLGREAAVGKGQQVSLRRS